MTASSIIFPTRPAAVPLAAAASVQSAPPQPATTQRPKIPGLVTSQTISPDRFAVLAGNAFAGKSTAAASFPDPLFLNFDNKLPKPGLDEIPFWNDKFVDSIVTRANHMNPANVSDAVPKWIELNARYLADRTVVVDSLSSLETAFHRQVEKVEGVLANVGGGMLFGRKLRYFNDLFDLLPRLAQRVIVCCHLCPCFVKDERTGADVATGRYKPAITGSFAEKLPSFATTLAFCQRNEQRDSATGAITHKYVWILKKCAAFDAGTLAANVPPSGELDVTQNAYEAFKRIF